MPEQEPEEGDAGEEQNDAEHEFDSTQCAANSDLRTVERELQDFLYREPTKVKINNINITYEGLIPQIQKSFLSKDVDAMQPHVRALVERAVTLTTCPECGGTRLNEAARSSRIEKINIADACAMQIDDLHGPGHDGRRYDGLRGLRGPAVPAVGAEVPAGPARHRRGARPVDPGRGRLLCRWQGGDARRARDPAAHGRRGTRLPAGCIWPISRSCSDSSTGWSTMGSRSSDRSTTRP
jgi:hypothetical protein